VPSSEKLVLLCLADCHNADTGQCNPSVNYICKKTSLDRKTILKSLRLLNDKNWLSRTKVEGSSNQYFLAIGGSPLTALGEGDISSKAVPNLGHKPKTKPKKNLRWENGDLETAESIYKLLLALNPKHKKPSMETWANTIRLMRESDGHTHNDIMNLFRFANSDSFWKSNILSPAKLREKWDVLTIKKGGTSAPTENIWV
jgi:hypothetical protein